VSKVAVAGGRSQGGACVFAPYGSRERGSRASDR